MPTWSPAPPTTVSLTATSASTCALSRARKSPKRAHGGSRRPSQRCGTDDPHVAASVFGFTCTVICFAPCNVVGGFGDDLGDGTQHLGGDRGRDLSGVVKLAVAADQHQRR